MRGRKRRRSGCALPTLFILAAALMIAGMIFMRTSDIFTVRSIIIDGADRVSPSQIEETSGIKIGDNMFSFHTSGAEKTLKADIMIIKSVRVIRILPDRVKIAVVERTPAYIFTGPYGCISVDEEGIVIGITQSPESPDAVIVSGYDTGELLIGEIMDLSSSAVLTTIRTVTSRLKEKGDLDLVSEIHVSSGGCYYIYSKNSNVVKFYSLSSFEANLEFIDLFLNCETRPIMVEVIEGSEPVYKSIDII